MYRLLAAQVDKQLDDDDQEREYTGCFEGPEKTLEVSHIAASRNVVCVCLFECSYFCATCVPSVCEVRPVLSTEPHERFRQFPTSSE